LKNSAHSHFHPQESIFNLQQNPSVPQTTKESSNSYTARSLNREKREQKETACPAKVDGVEDARKGHQRHERKCKEQKKVPTHTQRETERKKETQKKGRDPSIHGSVGAKVPGKADAA
jgi:hypothetical protein